MPRLAKASRGNKTNNPTKLTLALPFVFPYAHSDIPRKKSDMYVYNRLVHSHGNQTIVLSSVSCIYGTLFA